MQEQAAGLGRRSGLPGPRVSIGLPNHNGAQYLGRAIESLLAQDFGDFELIVSDNASTDDSVEVARSYARSDPRVRVYEESVNRGAAWNFNRAFDLARGSYFKWAAHDDMYEPTFLGQCVAALDEDPGVVLAYTQTVDIDESDTRIGVRAAPAVAGSEDVRDRMRSVLLTPSPCFEVFGLARREVLVSTGLIGPYTSSDRTLLLELASRGRFRLVDEELFLHRQHEDRSVFQYPRGRDRSVWFDPRLQGTITFPRWRLLREYGRVIGASPLQGRQRWASRGDLARWALANRTALVREVVGGGRDRVRALMARTVRRTNGDRDA